MTSVIKVADPRVVVEQGVVLNDYEGPLQWEHYKIPASGLSNTQITFANLVTLGTNRIYNSQFMVEYVLEVDYTASGADADTARNFIHLKPFPLSMVSDQIRCNINGSACVSRPATTLLQRLPYWRQKIIDKTCNEFPHELPPAGDPSIVAVNTDTISVAQGSWGTASDVIPAAAKSLTHSLRLSTAWESMEEMCEFDRKFFHPEMNVIDATYDTANNKIIFTVREPVLCPPFNTRLDNLYQRPLCNITSIDIVYTLNDLKLMLVRRAIGYLARADGTMTGTGWQGISHTASELDVNIRSAQLCFDVASLPNGMTVPPSITLPYYDYVNYVTDIPNGTSGVSEVTSGVYTLSQVPTAVYIFISDSMLYRTTYVKNNTYESHFPSYRPIEHIELTIGNNTKILDTTSMYDRYRMCVANGLEGVKWRDFKRNALDDGMRIHRTPHVLRLIPGIDFTIPEQRLVGGTPADQLVFQARCTANFGGGASNLALWIMFEYCGVLTIEPVHASIDMIPLKTIPPRGPPQVVASVAASDIHGGGEGTNPSGAGIFDAILSGAKWLGRKGLELAGNSGLLDKWAGKYGQKRMRIDDDPSGGSLMGDRDFYS